MGANRLASLIYAETGSERMALAVLRTMAEGYSPHPWEREHVPPPPKKGQPPLQPVESMAKARRNRWRAYKAEVWRRTERQPLHTLENIERRSFKGWHLDHVLSIYEGFKRGLPVDAIACISNLRMIDGRENMRKNTRTVYTNLFNEG